MDNISKSAFGPYLEALTPTSGDRLVVGEWTGAGIAAVMTSRAREDVAAAHLTFFSTRHAVHLLHNGPGQWLVIAQQPDAAWLDDLASTLDGSAQIFDQSAGFGLLTLDGNAARMLLQKGLFVDLDKALNADGASIGGLIAHMAVTVWRIAPDQFGIAVSRSFAGSFWHWFEAVAAAENIRPGGVR